MPDVIIVCAGTHTKENQGRKAGMRPGIITKMKDRK